MIVYIILILLIVVLSTALFFQFKSAKKQAEDGQQLLNDYQKRVDEMERLLADYRSLEQNFDNVGQGYEQALLAFDKMEEEKQKLLKSVETLQKQNAELQQNRTQASRTMLQKKEIIEKAAFEAKKEVVANPMAVLHKLNTILNANDIDAETPIDASDNVVVSDIVTKAINESGINAASYVTFLEEISEDVKSTMLLTNEEQVVRILTILLENAVKFTTEGIVRLTVRPEGSIIKFSVTDSGMGVPPEEAEHIFEPFVKLNNYFEGDGLGLSTARSLARRLEGDVILDKDYSETGSRFVLTLPF